MPELTARPGVDARVPFGTGAEALKVQSCGSETPAFRRRGMGGQFHLSSPHETENGTSGNSGGHPTPQFNFEGGGDAEVTHAAAFFVR